MHRVETKLKIRCGIGNPQINLTGLNIYELQCVNGRMSIYIIGLVF
jgi:hypothetical protein